MKRIKDIFKSSQKADELEDAPGLPKTPAAAPPVTPGADGTTTLAPITLTGPSTRAVSSSPYVSQMQQAMLSIRRTLHGFSLFDPKHDTKTFSAGNAAQNDNLSGETSSIDKFLSPIFERNVPNQKQFSKNDSQDSNFKPWSIINRIESLANIGTKDKAGNPKPDGSWGRATTAGLNALADIIQSLSEITVKLNVQEDGLSKEDANKIRALIPKDTSNTPDLSNKAKLITEELQKVQEKLETFISHITNTAFENKIKSTKIDAGYGTTKAPLEQIRKVPGAAETYIHNIKQDLTGNSLAPESLALLDLSNLPGLRAYMKNNTITVNGKDPWADPGKPDTALLIKFLDYLKNGINDGTIQLSQSKQRQQQNNKVEEFQDPWAKNQGK